MEYLQRPKINITVVVGIHFTTVFMQCTKNLLDLEIFRNLIKTPCQKMAMNFVLKSLLLNRDGKTFQTREKVKKVILPAWLCVWPASVHRVWIHGPSDNIWRVWRQTPGWLTVVGKQTSPWKVTIYNQFTPNT